MPSGEGLGNRSDWFSRLVGLKRVKGDLGIDAFKVPVWWDICNVAELNVEPRMDPEHQDGKRPRAGHYEAMRQRAERLAWRIIPARPFEPREVRLWFPLTLVMVLLSPLLLLAMGIVVFLPRPLGVNPAYLVLAVGRVLSAISGSQVDLESPQARVHIKLF